MNHIVADDPIVANLDKPLADPLLDPVTRISVMLADTMISDWASEAFLAQRKTIVHIARAGKAAGGREFKPLISVGTCSTACVTASSLLLDEWWVAREFSPCSPGCLVELAMTVNDWSEQARQLPKGEPVPVGYPVEVDPITAASLTASSRAGGALDILEKVVEVVRAVREVRDAPLI
ncbi:hypothetical protein FRACA_170038 [Frankia canadensis]|uniref:Uncharacterized protein n=1 Tax=Frankia canadensis TaxID=1836972 RepID=A0A2I2KN37_9ACTN|nr:hypothetical protein [Frankia canadensis]SNQ47078.1 hypothetical protein FRACA_170038 [Frankia canadensis]SOU54368.1 hypothetical protein FRACA_170038 [Frankia canadensis]